MQTGAIAQLRDFFATLPVDGIHKLHPSITEFGVVERSKPFSRLVTTISYPMFKEARCE